MLRICCLLLCMLLPCNSFAESTASNPELTSAISKLPKNSLRELPKLIETIEATESPKIKTILTSLLNGDLYYIRANKQVVRVVKNTEGLYDQWHILTDEQYPAVTKSKLKKIRTNNSIRGQIKSVLALLDLSHKDPSVRLEAVKRILDNPDKESTARLKKRLAKESDEAVTQTIQVAISVAALKFGSLEEQIAAVSVLAESLEPAANNVLSRTKESLTEKTAELAEGETLSAQEKTLQTAVNKALDKIEQKRDIYSFAENLFFGISLGSVLLLAAIGLAITFGVMGVINMAHGEMMMLGAYTTYVIQQMFPELINYSLFMAIPAAFLVSGLVGILIERGVIRYLKGRPLETLLATFGISLILQQLVRTIFSPLNRQVQAPDWMSGSLEINPIFSLTYNRLYIIIFSLAVFFALMLILKKTPLGLHVRAVAQNREMARALSIKSDWVDAITFGLGSGIAGIAGVVLSQLTNVGPNLGQSYIIDSFLVVVFGGVGNLWGTLVAAMSLGSMNKFLEPLTGSVLANIIVLVGLVLFIQKRPKGLFPQKGRSAD
ncbi:urea ABC transporter permease [Catenovulum maritimum]|uniref:Urea ABC transporter permease n=2 Tax=Catenovulum maritimum TaxID=1513271 RepID=A0A0J8GNK6_9ALTE|nr:urea ABC transporter permease [Catenovulum maritimum]